MKTEVKYGIIIGGLTILWVLGEFYLASAVNRPDLGNYTGALASIIPILGLLLGLRQKRKDLGGSISFKQSIQTGLFISLIAGLISAIFIFAYMTANPDAFETYYEYMQRTLPEQGLSPEEVQARIDQFKEYATPTFQALYFLIGSVVSGLLISAIIGFFIREKKKPVSAE
jgi:hypothetical protein